MISSSVLPFPIPIVIRMVSANKAKYDESVKELFAAKQVLAWILKYTLEEFVDDEIPEIMNHLSRPVISSIRMEPGQTNRDKIEKQSEEDVVIGEGKIYYDIRFSAFCPECKYPQ